MSAALDPFPARSSGTAGLPSDRLPRKRLFIGLIFGTSSLLCLLLLLGWIIPVVGFVNIHSSVPYITGLILAAAIITIVWGSLSLVLQIAFDRPFWGSQRVRGLTVRLLLPLMEGLAVICGISRDEVRRSFIKVNNQLTLSRHERLPPERILILLPHCVQRADCPVRLSYSVDACKRCGRCPISGLLALRDRYGVGLAVATGGSIARRIVVESRPGLILAVACERDLTAGIKDTYPLPVFGLLNQRPEGPCRNTLLDLDHLASVLERFTACPACARQGNGDSASPRKMGQA
ncbi:MAG: DUF116 domain-containing protein [Deltaproteobacteria bacterium]|jgi:hypothetical protein|nr:DUF116 domain-containing protein [Deltaproteobacteria bacterium]